MKVFKKLKWALPLTLMLVLVVLISVTAVLAAPIFTGFAAADFIQPDTIAMIDPPGIGDVGLPASAPAGTVSGWDIETVFFDYDADTDILYVGVDCGGLANPGIICGDADGDGLPGVTSSWLASLGGTDWPDLSATESQVLLIDTNLDNTAEVVIGVSDAANITTFAAYNRTLPGWTLPQSSFFFGTQLPNTVSIYANPIASAPDLEFSVTDFSTLPNFSFAPGQGFTFNALYFSGSQDDAGIGEDYVPGSAGVPIVIAGLNMDLGDLNDSPYPTLLASNGARHVLGSIYMGSCVDDELDGQPTTSSNGDDVGIAASTTTGTCTVPNDDEDGASPVLGNTWGDGSGQISYTITGGSGCLVAWADWDGDGDFDSTGTPGGVSELIINQAVIAGTGQTATITSPTLGDYGGAYPPTLNFRFRLFQANDQLFTNEGLPLTAGCPTGATPAQLEALVTGLASNGEVEDHQWPFDPPTAVTFASFEAQNNTPIVIAVAAVMLLLVSGGAMLVYKRSRV